MNDDQSITPGWPGIEPRWTSSTKSGVGTAASLKRHRKPLRNVNTEHAQSLGTMERLALLITDHVGTMGFFLIIFTWTVLWLGWNLLAPKALQFDPPTAFVFWLFISNLIQILLMPLIMVGQNLQGRHAEMRAENDYEVNVKAEQEIELILQHLEHQNQLLAALAQQLGVDSKEIKMNIANKQST